MYMYSNNNNNQNGNKNKIRATTTINIFNREELINDESNNLNNKYNKT